MKEPNLNSSVSVTYNADTASRLSPALPRFGILGFFFSPERSNRTPSSLGFKVNRFLLTETAFFMEFCFDGHRRAETFVPAFT